MASRPSTATVWSALVTILALGVGLALGHSDAGACGGWSVVDSPDPGADNFLFGVAASGRDDAWAVGSSRDASGRSRALALHWDGRTWRVVPTPSAGPEDSFLNAVAVASPTDAWAVGMRRDEAGRARTLAMRWDGRAWSTVPTPNFSSADHRLSSVAIVSRDLVWAVGDAKHDGTFRSLLLRWDGKRWTPVSVPVEDSAGHALAAVSVAGDRATAVGGTWRPNGGLEPLVLTWDGSTWRRADASLAREHGTVLAGVSTSALGSAWVVGGLSGIRGPAGFAATSSSAGGPWTAAGRTLPGGVVSDSLSGVASFGDGSAWAVGSAFDGKLERTLIERGGDGAWTRAPSPNVAGRDNHLLDVAALPNGEAWAVGSSTGPDAGEHTLIQHHCAAAGAP
jgi:hypothetical protein